LLLSLLEKLTQTVYLDRVLKILGVAHPGEKTCGNRKESP
jgi:hypothetical protein